MRKHILVLCFVIMLASNLQAIPVPFPKPKQAKTELKKDTLPVNTRRFNAKALNKYLNDSEFNYVEKQNHPPGWWKRFWRWVWAMWDGFWNAIDRLLSKLFGRSASSKSVASVIKYVLIVAVALGLGYIIARLFGMDLLRLFRKRKVEVDVPYTESLENIHEINFDDDIEAAMSVKNYRLAVRLLYLRSLKQLSDVGAINWRLEKTNSAYLNELTDGEQRRQFTAITRQFEYVWYGDFPVDGPSFQRINQLFQDFKKQVAP